MGVIIPERGLLVLSGWKPILRTWQKHSMEPWPAGAIPSGHWVETPSGRDDWHFVPEQAGQGAQGQDYGG